MSLQIAFFLAGVGQFLAGWLFFRHPGQRFWVIAPVWRASDYLLPAGVALWVGGIVLMWVGVVGMFLSPLG